MIYFFYSLYHYDKSTNSVSDFTTGYEAGGYWRDKRESGIFDEHGNHQRDYCGSQTLIIITTTVIMEKLSMKYMAVLLGMVAG